LVVLQYLKTWFEQPESQVTTHLIEKQGETGTLMWFVFEKSAHRENPGLGASFFQGLYLIHTWIWVTLLRSKNRRQKRKLSIRNYVLEKNISVKTSVA
jgi:hypothetical protein